MGYNSERLGNKDVIRGNVLLFKDIKIWLLITARKMNALFRENHYLELSTTANNRIRVSVVEHINSKQISVLSILSNSVENKIFAIFAIRASNSQNSLARHKFHLPRKRLPSPLPKKFRNDEQTVCSQFCSYSGLFTGLWTGFPFLSSILSSALTLLGIVSTFLQF